MVLGSVTKDNSSWRESLCCEKTFEQRHCGCQGSPLSTELWKCRIQHNTRFLFTASEHSLFREWAVEITNTLLQKVWGVSSWRRYISEPHTLSWAWSLSSHCISDPWCSPSFLFLLCFFLLWKAKRFQGTSALVFIYWYSENVLWPRSFVQQFLNHRD